MTRFLLNGDGRKDSARRGKRCAIPRYSRCRLPAPNDHDGVPGGTKWPMQPFWALSFPSLEALEECERVHFKAVPAKKRGRKITTPPGMQYPLAPRSDTNSELLTADAAFGFSEMIAEHFARSAYIW